MNWVDFGRSFLKFTSDHARHTPRLQVDALCTLRTAGGREARYALTSPCICETMYAPSDLVQRPSGVFRMIASTEEFMMLKDFAGAKADAREPRRVGEAMSTHDGKGSRVLRIEIDVAERGPGRRLEGYEEIREAILGNAPLNGRTTLREGRTEAVMDYPIRVCNVPHTQRAWQVDTGPVLMLQGAEGPGLTVARLTPGYLVYNAWDWAEGAMLCYATEGSGLPVARFSDVRRLAGRNEIFCAG